MGSLPATKAAIKTVVKNAMAVMEIALFAQLNLNKSKSQQLLAGEIVVIHIETFL
jgi:hypothetical protein